MPKRLLGGIFLTLAASVWGGMFVAVKIAVDNSDGQIKLGMYGSVDFTKKTSK